MGRQKSTWKHAERTVAGLVGGERTGPTGRAVADVKNDWLNAEVKHRKKLPAWILSALAQARADANPRQLPIAVLHQKNQRYTDSLVVMRMADFIAWFGDPLPEASE